MPECMLVASHPEYTVDMANRIVLCEFGCADGGKCLSLPGLWETESYTLSIEGADVCRPAADLGYGVESTLRVNLTESVVCVSTGTTRSAVLDSFPDF